MINRDRPILNDKKGYEPDSRENAHIILINFIAQHRNKINLEQC